MNIPVEIYVPSSHLSLVSTMILTHHCHAHTNERTNERRGIRPLLRVLCPLLLLLLLTFLGGPTAVSIASPRVSPRYFPRRLSFDTRTPVLDRQLHRPVGRAWWVQWRLSKYRRRADSVASTRARRHVRTLCRPTRTDPARQAASYNYTAHRNRHWPCTGPHRQNNCGRDRRMSAAQSAGTVVVVVRWRTSTVSSLRRRTETPRRLQSWRTNRTVGACRP